MKYLLIVFIAILCSCKVGVKDPSYSHPQKNEIKNALIQMIAKPTIKSVIVLEPKKNRYVYIYNMDDKVSISLFKKTLDLNETKKANRHFMARDIELKKIRLLDMETGSESLDYAWVESYSVKHIDNVVQFILGIFYDIYGISNTVQIQIKKTGTL